MPEEAKRLEFVTMLNYSTHARSAAKRDRHGMIALPKIFDTRKASLIEAVVKGGRVTRALYRMKYDAGLDLSLVILPEKSLVVTVWLNDDSDKHRTLDRGQYARG